MSSTTTFHPPLPITILSRSSEKPKKPVITNMVFHDARRWRKAPEPKTPKTTINDLPVELIVQILQDTPTRDILKLRETSRVFANAGTEMLRKRLKVLYVHPTKASLRQAIEVCNSDLCLEIEEICLIGKVAWHEIRQTLRDPDYGDDTTKLDNLGASQYNDFHAWPSTMPKARAGSAKRGGYTTWTSAYDELLDALAKLPKVYKLSFASWGCEVGFNPVSDATVGAHTCKTALHFPVTTVGKAKIRQEPAFSDVDALFSIMGSSRLRSFKALRITEDLPFASAICRSLHGNLNPLLRDSLHRLETVVLCLSAGWDATEWQYTCRRVLAYTPILRNLTIELKHNDSVRKAHFETFPTTLLEDQNFPNLESLTFSAILPQPQNGRMWRPIPCAFDIADFLDRHRQTLDEVTLNNLTFGDTPTEDHGLQQFDAVLDIADGLTGSSEVTGGKTRERKAGFRLLWTVNNYTRDPRCNKADGGAGHNCKNDCGILRNAYFSRPLTAAEFATFAGSKGVPLDKDKNVWEFTEDDREDGED